MPATLPELTTDSELAFVRAGYYRFLARAFAYPSAGTAEALRNELPDSDTAVLWGKAGDGVKGRLAEVKAALQDLTDDGMESMHLATYGHTISETFPPHETRYGSAHPFQETQDLADVTAFYRAFGLQVRGGTGERADHAWLELEFVHFLAVKQLVALERGEVEGAGQTLEAARAFLKDHIGRWGPVFGEILAKKAPNTLHRALGALLASVLQSDASRLDVTPGEVSAEPIAIPPEPAPETEDGTEENESSDCGV